MKTPLLSLIRRAVLTAGASVALVSAPVFAQDKTIRIAYIDPASGLMAPVGAHGLKELQFLIMTIKIEKMRETIKILNEIKLISRNQMK